MLRANDSSHYEHSIPRFWKVERWLFRERLVLDLASKIQMYKMDIENTMPRYKEVVSFL